MKKTISFIVPIVILFSFIAGFFYRDHQRQVLFKELDLEIGEKKIQFEQYMVKFFSEEPEKIIINLLNEKYSKKWCVQDRIIGKKLIDHLDLVWKNSFSDYKLGFTSHYWSMQILDDDGHDLYSVSDEFLQKQNVGISFVPLTQSYVKNNSDGKEVYYYRDELYFLKILPLKQENCFNRYIGFILDNRRLFEEVFNSKKGYLFGNSKFLYGNLNKKLKEEILHVIENKNIDDKLKFNLDNKHYYALIKKINGFIDLYITIVREEK